MSLAAGLPSAGAPPLAIILCVLQVGYWLAMPGDVDTDLFLIPQMCVFLSFVDSFNRRLSLVSCQEEIVYSHLQLAHLKDSSFLLVVDLKLFIFVIPQKITSSNEIPIKIELFFYDGIFGTKKSV